MDTLNSAYTSKGLTFTTKHQAQYERLERLILGFNQGLKEEVTQAKTKYNQSIRHAIADKTGLSLSFKANVEDRYFDKKDRASIPIKITDRVPDSLLKIFDEYDDSQIELLLHYRQMKRTVRELAYQLENYPDFSEYHKNTTTLKEIQATVDHLRTLIKEVEDSGILEAINKLGPDLLGAYYFYETRVELYWLCIGLCSIIHELPVVDFTLVVLTHELAHGYTHIGFDKDGHYWETDVFKITALPIVEGFAQFYTEAVCSDHFGSATPAFEALLTKQASEYTEYKNWFDKRESDKYEKARKLLLTTRTRKITGYNEFLSNLKHTKREF